MKSLKRILALLLSLAMIFTSLTVTVLADTAEENPTETEIVPVGITSIFHKDDTTTFDVVTKTGSKLVFPAYEGTEVFKGWCENSDGSGTLYKAGEELEITQAMEFYAITVAPVVKVTVGDETHVFDSAETTKAFLETVEGDFSFEVLGELESDPTTWGYVAATVEQGDTLIYYSTLPAAISKANKLTVGGTDGDRVKADIVVYKDITLASRMNFYVSAWNEGNYRLITFDLNGHTITYSKTVDQLFYVNKFGSMIIKDSSPDGTGKVQCPSGLNKALFYTSGNYKYQTYDIYGGTFTGSTNMAAYASRTNFHIHGGTFSLDVSEYVDVGLEVKDNGDGTWTVTSPENIAEVTIGEITKTYSSLDEAFTAANVAGSEATIKLLEDTVWKSELTVADKLVIDINGKTLALDTTAARFATVGKDAALSIISTAKGGTLTSSKATSLSGAFDVDGTLSIAKGIAFMGGIRKSVDAVVTADTAAEVIVGNEDAVFNDFAGAKTAILGSTNSDGAEGTLKLLSDYTVTNGRICFFGSWDSDLVARVIMLDLNGYTINQSGYTSSFPYAFIINHNGYLKIIDSENGGSIVAGESEYSIRIFQNAYTYNEIYGGTFTGFDTIGGTANIYGGTFEFDPSTNEKITIPEGYEVTENEGKYTVAEAKTYVASVVVNAGSVTETKYRTLEEAVKAAVAATPDKDDIAIINILSDIVLSKKIDISGASTLSDDTTERDISIELNGHEISTSAALDYFFGINKGGKLFVTDTSEEKTGKLTAFAGTKRYLSASSNLSSFRIIGGTFTGAETLDTEYGTFDIISGTFDKDPSAYADYLCTVTKTGDLWTVNGDVSIISIEGGVKDKLSLYIDLMYFTEKAPVLNCTINGVTTQITIDEAAGLYILPALPFNMIEEEISLTIAVPDGTVCIPYTFTAMDYLEMSEAEAKDDEAMQTLLADIIVLSQALQVYSGEGEEIVVPAWAEEKKTTSAPSKEDDIFEMTGSGSDSFKYAIRSMTLYISDQVAIACKVETNDPQAKLVVTKEGGETPLEFTNPELVMIDGISPLDYDAAFTFELKDASGSVMKMAKYSVNSYCFRMADSKAAAVISAIYNLGAAAETLEKAE